MPYNTMFWQNKRHYLKPEMMIWRHFVTSARYLSWQSRKHIFRKLPHKCMIHLERFFYLIRFHFVPFIDSKRNKMKLIVSISSFYRQTSPWLRPVKPWFRPLVFHFVPFNTSKREFEVSFHSFVVSNHSFYFIKNLILQGF